MESAGRRSLLPPPLYLGPPIWPGHYSDEWDDYCIAVPDPGSPTGTSLADWQRFSSSLVSRDHSTFPLLEEIDPSGAGDELSENTTMENVLGQIYCHEIFEWED